MRSNSCGIRSGGLRAGWLGFLGGLVGVVIAVFGGPNFGEAASSAVKNAGQEQWDQAVKAANKEGRVAVLHAGSSSTAMRRLFKQGFEKHFPQIQVDLLAAGGRSSAPRLLAERGAGKYKWDVYIGGTTTALRLLMPAGAIDPIRSAFILPEVSDPSKWFGGKLDFSDETETFNLAFGGFVIPPFAFNTRLVKKDKIRSLWDLLNPEWQGKVIMIDPRMPGAGLSTVTFWYNHAELGKEFIRRFFTEQKVGLIREYRSLLVEVAHGNYLLAIGVDQGIYQELVAKGLPLGSFSAEQIKESSYLTTATASLSLINRAPHPNAAKVYINWFLSKETQTAYSKASGYWSRRVDVPQDHLDPGIVPKAGKHDLYVPNYKERYVKMRGEIVGFLKKLLDK